MSKWNDIDKKLISEITFESEDVKEFIFQFPEESIVYYDISSLELDSMPPRTPTEDMIILRKMLSELFVNNLNKNYATLETRCDIKRDTFQKILKSHNGRGISRTMLAKFVVGAKIDLDTADEMFLCLGNGFDKRNRFDYIVICALRDKDDIDELNKDLMKYGYPSIYSKPD